MLLSALLLLAAILPAPLLPPAAALRRHPHFPKRVEMSLGLGDGAPVIAVSHITVTFDRDGFEKMPAGGVWHLGNSHLETSVDVVIGGRKVARGRYRLLARKREDGAWELLLDREGRDFGASLSKDVIVLKTRFMTSQPLNEHLRLDLQPSGNAQNTVIHLEVHFDRYAALSAIEVP